MRTEATTSRMLLKMPVRVMTRPEVLPICTRTSVSIQRVVAKLLHMYMQRAKGLSYQEYAGNIENEGNRGVKEQHSKASTGGVFPVELGYLTDEGNEEVHNRTDRRVVVETDKGVHVEPFAAEHDLNHDHANGFKASAPDLEKEANP